MLIEGYSIDVVKKAAFERELILVEDIIDENVRQSVKNYFLSRIKEIKDRYGI
jgi:hypothetical protein